MSWAAILCFQRAMSHCRSITRHYILCVVLTCTIIVSFAGLGQLARADLHRMPGSHGCCPKTHRAVRFPHKLQVNSESRPCEDHRCCVSPGHERTPVLPLRTGAFGDHNGASTDKSAFCTCTSNDRRAVAPTRETRAGPDYYLLAAILRI